MKQIPFILLALALLAAACAPAEKSAKDDSPQSVLLPTEAPIALQPTANAPMPDHYPVVTPLPQKTDNTIPRRADQTLDAVYLDSVNLLAMESFPPQFSLEVMGNLPTPCHQLVYEVHPPDEANKIVVDVNALGSVNAMCTEVLQPFSAVIPLGSFPEGHYTVWINGAQAAEFDGR